MHVAVVARHVSHERLLILYALSILHLRALSAVALVTSRSVVLLSTVPLVARVILLRHELGLKARSICDRDGSLVLLLSVRPLGWI